MIRAALALVFLTGLSLGAAQAQAPAQPGATADLTIHVQNVLPDGGILRLGIYDRARYPDDDATPVASADVEAQPGQTTITLHGIAPGDYAIETFQDVNANGKMDTSWIGLPREPFGFSNDAAPHLGKPSFERVKITLTPGENIQAINLQDSVALLAAN